MASSISNQGKSCIFLKLFFLILLLPYFTTSVFLGKYSCYLFIPVNFPSWSNLPFSACFTPTSTLHQIHHLEQSSLFCLLCSYFRLPINSPLGAISSFPLALLLLPLTIKFPSWSNLPFSAYFTPTSTHKPKNSHEHKAHDC